MSRFAVAALEHVFHIEFLQHRGAQQRGFHEFHTCMHASDISSPPGIVNGVLPPGRRSV